MKEYSSRPPFCVSYRPTIFDDIEVPFYAYHAYDAVMLYAQALTESLRDGYDPRNGTNIVERIRSRVYHSVLGYDVSMNAYTCQSYNPISHPRFFFVSFLGVHRFQR